MAMMDDGAMTEAATAKQLRAAARRPGGRRGELFVNGER